MNRKLREGWGLQFHATSDSDYKHIRLIFSVINKQFLVRVIIQFIYFKINLI